MGFTKNDPNANRSGRPKGALNHSTVVKQKLITILDKMINSGELERKLRISEFYKGAIQLLPKETKLEVSTDQPVQIDINFNIKKKEKEEGKEEKEGGDAKSHA